MKLIKASLTCLLVFFTFFSFSASFSQGYNEPFIFYIDNSFPEFGEEVLIGIQTENVSTRYIKSVIWYQNGEELIDEKNNISIKITAGINPIEIVANVIYTNDTGDREYSQIREFIRPITFDILWEAEGVAPPNYRGHLLASYNTPINLIAKIQLISSADRIYEEKDFFFRWEINTKVHPKTGPGLNSIQIEGSDLINNNLHIKAIATLITNQEIKIEKTIFIPILPPKVFAYKYDLLYGLLDDYVFTTGIKNNETISLYPFFYNISDFEKNNIQYNWYVNNSRTPAKRGRKINISLEGENLTIPFSIEAINENNNEQEATNSIIFNI